MRDPEMRVGNTQREAAQRLLEEHYQAGRLDPHEYEDRRGRAGDAITQADLDALFTDLPPQPGESSAAGQPGTDLASVPPRPARRLRDTIMALLPFAALLLFFRTGAWLWFLAIPVGAIILYGPSGRDGDRDT
jgi:hypothetical protein